MQQVMPQDLFDIAFHKSNCFEIRPTIDQFRTDKDSQKKETILKIRQFREDTNLAERERERER